MHAVGLFIQQLLVFSVEYQPVVEIFGVVVLWLICYFLLVGCGLLLACPSPPCSAPACPSPLGKLLVLALLLLVRGCSTLPPSSASRDQLPWFDLLGGVWCCENLVFSWLLWFWPKDCVLSLPAVLIYSSCWQHGLAVVLTTPHLVSVTELLVSS
jgi:hypothetical protein